VHNVRVTDSASAETDSASAETETASTEALSQLRVASEICGMQVDEIVLPADEHLVADGLRLHYLDWGLRGRPQLLFLHGGRLTAHTWDLVCLGLRMDFHCLALDQRGHGDSEWSPSLDYGPDAHARDIDRWIQHLDAVEPILIGHSLGGLNAMTYVTQASRRVAGLVMVDVGPGVRGPGAQRIVDFGANDPGPAPFEDFVKRAVAFNPRRDPRLLRRSLLHNLRRLPDGRWTWKYDNRRLAPEFFASTKARVEQLRERASSVTCPVLVVRGAESDVYGDAEAEAFARALPHGRWAKVESAGHNVQGDNPPGLIHVLTPFLQEIA
jgi:pimeloyl-ACP methyl ester carboxylesterase